MKAQVLERAAPISDAPLRLVERDAPEPGRGEVRLRAHVCACCRTDLHVVTGELDLPKLPVVPGHQVVGTVDALGHGARTVQERRLGSAQLGEQLAECAGALARRIDGHAGRVADASEA